MTLPNYPMSLIQLAKLTGKTRGYFYHLKNSGKLKTERLDGIVLIPTEEIQRLVEEGKIVLS